LSRTAGAWAAVEERGRETNMPDKTEDVEGYVVDAACIRSYPQDEMLERARVHTSECTLMGHCIESGYGLIDEQGRVAMLDPKATPMVEKAVRASGKAEGVRLRASRQEVGRKMETTRVEEV